MRTSLRIGAALLLTACIVATPSAAAAGAVQPPDCGTADQLLRAGSLDAAQLAYESAGGACGAAGITAVERQRAGAQRIAETAQRIRDEAQDAATADAQTALKLHDGNELAKALLKQPPKPDATGLCDAGELAVGLGQWQRANELFDAASTIEANEACAAAGKAKAEQVRLESWPARVSTSAAQLTPWLVLAAVAFLASALLVAALRRTWGPRSSRRRWWRPVRVLLVGVAAVAAVTTAASSLSTTAAPAPFRDPDVVGAVLAGSAAVVGLLAGWRFTSRRRLAFGSFGGDAGDALAAQTASTFTSMTQAPPSGVEVVGLSDSVASPVEEVGTLAPHPVVKALVAAWKVLAPATDLTLTAHVVSTAGGERTAAVTLKRGRRTVAAESISTRPMAADPGEPTPEELAEAPGFLATAIAGWLFLELTRDRPEPRLYGAGDWRGLALNVVAGRLVEQQDLRGAQRLLGMALTADPRNVALQFARHSIALRLAGADVAANERVVDQLETLYRGQVLSRAGEAGPLARLPLGWRISYAYGAAMANLGVMQAEAGTLPRALEVLRDLVDQLKTERGRGGAAAKDRPLAARIDRLARAALQAVRIAAREENWRDVARNVSLAKRPLSADPRREYNLACAAAAVARQPSPPQAPWAAEAVTRLRVAGDYPAHRAWIPNDPWFSELLSTQAYKDLVLEWSLAEAAPTPQAEFATLDSIGGLADELAAMGYLRESTLRQALEDGTLRAAVQQALDVDDATIGRWRGALAWREQRVPTDVINSAQRAGYADTGALAQEPAEAAMASIRPWHRLSRTADEQALTTAVLQVMGAQ